MNPFVRLFLSGAVAGGLAGCSFDQATGRPPSELAVRLPVAGGDSVTIPFTRDGAVHAQDDAYRIEKAMLQVNPQTSQWAYDFVLSPKTAVPIRHVRVEDVTDASAVALVDDIPGAQGAQWERRSPPFSLSMDSTAWLYNQDNTIRVYRFTIEDAQGHASILYEAYAYPAFIKASILESEQARARRESQ